MAAPFQTSYKLAELRVTKGETMNRIGNTPLFRLEHLPEAGSAEVYVKWEGANRPAA